MSDRTATVINTINEKLEDNVASMIATKPNTYEYMGDTDTFSAADIRKALKPLGAFKVTVQRKGKYATECEIVEIV